ncbi:MAG: NAD(P)-binding protein [Pseudomonadales bacterium]
MMAIKNDWKSPIAGISRRDFVNGSLIGVGGALVANAMPTFADPVSAFSAPGEDWYGYGGVGDYRLSHGNTPELVATAHQIRDGHFKNAPAKAQSTESYDLVIVGCGMAGLGAALEYTSKHKAGQKCLMLDNHPLFGGEAKENEFSVNGVTLFAPQGANGFFVPEQVTNPDEARGDARYYAQLGIPRDLPYAPLPDTRPAISFCNDNFGYLVRGLQDRISIAHYFPDNATSDSPWALDMWNHELDNTPLAKKSRKSLLEWYRSGQTQRFESEIQARKFLDQMSYKRFLEDVLKMPAECAEAADLFLASAVRLGSDAVSAYAAYQLPMSGLSDVPPESLRRHSFPGGNSGYARYFLKTLIPDSIEGSNNFDGIITGRINFPALDRPGQPLNMRLNATAFSVKHSNAQQDSVEVLYREAGQNHAVKAKAVIMATGGWINRYVVKDLPEDYRKAYSEFQHAAFLVANVALTNWRFMERLGISGAIWDRGEHEFGYTCNIRRPMHVGRHKPALDPDQPAVLTFYTPFFYPGRPIREQTLRGRMELFSTSYAEYESKIISQMVKLFAKSGFKPRSDVAGIVLNRWGHAYSVPYPGFYGGRSNAPAPRDIIRQNYGRISFAHSELDGLQHWGPAADEGRRAFTQLAAAL